MEPNPRQCRCSCRISVTQTLRSRCRYYCYCSRCAQTSVGPVADAVRPTCASLGRKRGLDGWSSWRRNSHERCFPRLTTGRGSEDEGSGAACQTDALQTKCPSCDKAGRQASKQTGFGLSRVVATVYRYKTEYNNDLRNSPQRGQPEPSTLMVKRG